MSGHGIEELKSHGNPFSAEIRTAIRDELELILAAPAFSQSNRCKTFLKFVVLQTIAGHASELKERTIGINVFERAIDYDTGGDSIVRVTSNEVRKRIGQFYRESETNHAIQIELPRGSYVPEFRIQPRRMEEGASQPNPAVIPHLETSISETPIDHSPVSTHAEPAGQTLATHVQPPVESIEIPVSRHSRRTVIIFAALAAALVIASAVYGIWQSQMHKQFPQVWESFEHTSSPVLICLGTHNLAAPKAPSNEATESFSDLVLHKEMIPVDDVTVITSMASLLGKKGIPFRVMGARQASLTDLRTQPIILIGGVDNRWTLRLTQDLRYRIERVDPGGGKEPIGFIVDSQSPGDRWTIDFSIPMYSWKNDYAVVARIDDQTTGVPVLVDAGLGNDGSLAASELLASDALQNQLKAQPGCSGKKNFEAVIETEIIDAKPGPPHILRLQCW
jgi:hypothetical protein